VRQERTIILASTSPRRKELLEQIGLNFKVFPSQYEEDLKQDLPAEELVKVISLGKATEAAESCPDSIVIAADTIGVIRKEILGKPKNADEARKMLARLQGKSHRVITGYTVLDSKTNKVIRNFVETRVYLKNLTTEEIRSYVSSGEPLDKAGAYGIQGLGAVIVEKIVGDYYNVMGLPLSSLAESLKEFGIDILRGEK
jgi:septum formation protein